MWQVLRLCCCRLPHHRRWRRPNLRIPRRPRGRRFSQLLQKLALLVRELFFGQKSIFPQFFQSSNRLSDLLRIHHSTNLDMMESFNALNTGERTFVQETCPCRCRGPEKMNRRSIFGDYALLEPKGKGEETTNERVPRGQRKGRRVGQKAVAQPCGGKHQITCSPS